MRSYLRNIGYETFLKPYLKNRIKEGIHLTEEEYLRLLEGKLSLIFEDEKKLSSILQIPLPQLMTSNKNAYEGMIHSEGRFSSQENCEYILDLIDSYIDLEEALPKKVSL